MATEISEVKKQIAKTNSVEEGREKKKPDFQAILPSGRAGSVTMSFAVVKFWDYDAEAFGEPVPQLSFSQPGRDGYQRIRAELSEIDKMIDYLQEVKGLVEEYGLISRSEENRMERAREKLSDLFIG